MNSKQLIKTEFAEIRQMPLFFVRFITMIIMISANDMIAVFVNSWVLLPICVVAAIALVTYIVAEIKVIRLYKIRFRAKKAPLLFFGVFVLICLISMLFSGFTYNALLLLVIIPIFIVMGQERAFYKMYLCACGCALLIAVTVALTCYPLIDNNISLCFAYLFPIPLCAIAFFLKYKKLYILPISSLVLFACLFCFFRAFRAEEPAL